MKVIAENVGNRIKVVAQQPVNQDFLNAIRTSTAVVDDNGRITLDAFQGKSIDFIKQYFRGDVDGVNVIGLNSTTLHADGVITVGTYLAGQTVNILQLGETFYTSDAKKYRDEAEAAKDEIVDKFPFDTIANGQYVIWDASQNKFVPINGGGGGGSVSWGDINGTLADQTDLQGALNLKANDADLATVAKSGDYNDLSNRPTIPPAAPVDSVNGQTGVVDLDADDIDDSATANKFASQAELDKLAGVEAGAQVNDVDSVAGKTGAVTLDKNDVGLGNVDNTSDLAKPISSAAQAALDNKLDDITAGSNITIDKTNPLNPIISASGGGSLTGYQEAALALKVDPDNVHFWGDPANPSSGQTSAGTFGADYDVSYDLTNAGLPFEGIRVDLGVFANTNSTRCKFAFIVDNDNYAEVTFNQAQITINEVLAGSSTQLFTGTNTLLLGGNLANRITLILSGSRLIFQAEIGNADDFVSVDNSLRANDITKVAFKTSDTSGANFCNLKNAIIQGGGITSMP